VLSLSVGLGVALGVAASWPFARGEGYLLALGGAAIACLCLGLLALWVRGLAWGIALLAATFLLRVQIDQSTASAWTPVAAGALLLVAELGYWSFELDGSNTAGSAPVARRSLEVVLLVIAAAALGELVLDLGAILPISGSWVLVLGVASVAGLLGMMLRVARRAET
jgi:hypothetical protein